MDKTGASRLRALSERASVSNKVWHDDVTARDLAIWEEHGSGATRQAIADATGLSVMRIQQIVDDQYEKHQVVKVVED